MFKVRCKFVSFLADAERFPCHFNYKEGDEFYYDGVHFTGRICPGLLASMMPVIWATHLMGNRCYENVMYRYRGLDAHDPSMAKYDGVGFRPWNLETLPEDAPQAMVKTVASTPKTEKAKGGWHFECGDFRTLAHFSCEAVDLSDSDYCQPFYRRAIAILEKIGAEPGIKTDEIRDRFTDFERDKISPPLTPILTKVILDALTDMNYIEIHDGKAQATGKEPPSRPKIG